MKKAIALMLGLSMTLSLAACGGGGSSSGGSSSGGTSSTGSSGVTAEGVSGKTVTFIPKVTGNAFFEVANTGAQKYAKDWGITVDYQGSANAAVADQVQVINTAVASGTDAICIST